MLLDKAVELIQSDKTSEKVKSTLILGLMDRAGIIQKAPTVSININTEISDRARQILSQTLPASTGEPGQM